MRKSEKRYRLFSKPKNYGKIEKGNNTIMVDCFDDLDIAKKNRDENIQNDPTKEWSIFDRLEKEFIYEKYDKNEHANKLANSFKVLIHKLHKHTNEMIVAEALDMHVKAQAAALNSYLELELSEYFKEKK